VRITAERGDLTTVAVDAIVNAANPVLLGGGGVDGAIHAAAGPKLLEACRRLRRTRVPDGLSPGRAVATDGFDLPARWVIHTVGPNWNRGQRDPAVLTSCFITSLNIANWLGAKSVAFPAISAGSYGWDVDVVARTGVAAVRHWHKLMRCRRRAGVPAGITKIAARRTRPDPEDVLVVIGHPWGDSEPMPLTSWIEFGPHGSERPLIGPVSASLCSTGEPVPLSQIDRIDPFCLGRAPSVTKVRFVLATASALDAFTAALASTTDHEFGQPAFLLLRHI